MSRKGKEKFTSVHVTYIAILKCIICVLHFWCNAGKTEIHVSKSANKSGCILRMEPVRSGLGWKGVWQCLIFIGFQNYIPGFESLGKISKELILKIFHIKLLNQKVLPDCYHHC